MKALSLWEPWATAFVTMREDDIFPLKRFETRSWATAYRGPLAIHAAKTSLSGVGRDLTNRYGMARLNYGCIVCIGDLTDCLPIVDEKHLLMGKRCVAVDEDGLVRLWEPQRIEQGHSRPVLGHCADMTSATEADFGDYAPGRYAWELANVRPLAVPYPVAGHQGLWTVPDDVTALIEHVLAAVAATA